MAFDLREWSDTWAIRFKRDPEKFFKQIKDIDLVSVPIKELATKLDIPEDRADYMKRGFNRKGKPRSTAGVGAPPTINNSNLRILARVQGEYQKLLERETRLENELAEIRREKGKDKYKMVGRAAEILTEVAKKDKEDVGG